MSIKKSLVIVISSITLFSCGFLQHDYNLYTIAINARDYVVEGNTKYQFGKEANLTIIPKNKAFLLPNDEDITVYGANNISYDKSTGKLNFVVNRDVRLDIKTNTVYGQEVTLPQAGLWFNAHINTNDYTWTKQKYNWNLPNVVFPDVQLTSFIKDELIAQNDFAETFSVTSATGNKDILNTEHKEFPGTVHNVGILGRNNNRYYISNNHLTFGTDTLNKSILAASGGMFIFWSLNEQMIMDRMDFYFDNYLPYQTYEFNSTLNGELHWSTDTIEAE